MSQKLQPVRGTHDLLPADTARFRFIRETALRIATCYGYGEIMTPLFEFSDVFHRTLGDTSDVVSKETYSFTDRGGEQLTLRPEFTASIARSFISNSLQDSLPLKFFYAGAAFRYERPQKGRQRQFHQIGVELLGVEQWQGDVESIALADKILHAFGLKDKIQLEINTLGDAESRANYREALVAYFRSHAPQLSEESKLRLERNPLRILDSKDEADRKIVANAPNMHDYLTQEARDFFQHVQEGLTSLGIAFVLNPTLVRGLDYYNHTVFEFTTSLLGSQSTVLAGGRYDGLIALMGGEPTAGIGWAAGMERLMALIDFDTVSGFQTAPRPIAIIPLGEVAEHAALIIADNLRSQGFAIDMAYKGNMKNRLKKADKAKAIAAVIIGEEEINRKVAVIKNLDTGEQVEVASDALIQALESYRNR